MLNVIRYALKPERPQIIANQEITVYTRAMYYAFDNKFFEANEGVVTLKTDIGPDYVPVPQRIPVRTLTGTINIPDNIISPTGALNQRQIDSKIQDLKNQLIEISYFRGYILKASDLQLITDATPNDYAYVVNAETGDLTQNNKIWIYSKNNDDVYEWTNTMVDAPSTVIEPYDNLPSIASDEGNAGVSIEYARGDHSHPHDPTKVSIITDMDSKFVYGYNSETEDYFIVEEDPTRGTIPLRRRTNGALAVGPASEDTDAVNKGQLTFIVGGMIEDTMPILYTYNIDNNVLYKNGQTAYADELIDDLKTGRIRCKAYSTDSEVSIDLSGYYALETVGEELKNIGKLSASVRSGDTVNIYTLSIVFNDDKTITKTFSVDEIQGGGVITDILLDGESTVEEGVSQLSSNVIVKTALVATTPAWTYNEQVAAQNRVGFEIEQISNESDVVSANLYGNKSYIVENPVRSLSINYVLANNREYHIAFTTAKEGSSSYQLPNISFPIGTHWEDGEFPSFVWGKYYEVSIQFGNAIVKEFGDWED